MDSEMKTNPLLDKVWENLQWVEFQALLKQKNNRIDNLQAEKDNLHFEDYLNDYNNLDKLSTYKIGLRDNITNMGFDFKKHSNTNSPINYTDSEDKSQTQEVFRKTSICKYWELGKCNKADCNFAHGSKELHSTEDIYKTTLCKYYKLGTCTRGDSCRHAHGEKDLRRLPASEDNQLIKRKVPTPNLTSESSSLSPTIIREAPKIQHVAENIDDKFEKGPKDEHICEIMRKFLETMSCISKEKCLKCQLLIMLLNKFFSIDSNCDSSKSCDCKSHYHEDIDNNRSNENILLYKKTTSNNHRDYLISKKQNEAEFDKFHCSSISTHTGSNLRYKTHLEKSNCSTTGSSSSLNQKNYDVQSTRYSVESSEVYSEDGSQFEIQYPDNLFFLNGDHDKLNMSQVADNLTNDFINNQNFDSLSYIDLITNYRKSRPNL